MIGAHCRFRDRSSTRRAAGGRGFTLVELLVVITIIGILIGLLAPVVANAIYYAKVSRIATEISNLDGAFKNYKEKYGSYPPSDISPASLSNQNNPQYILLSQHLAKAFPRCNVQTEINAIISLNVATPAQSLCFWLSGFNTDPEHPISNKVQNIGTNSAPFFPFDNARLSTPAGSPAVPYFSPSDTPGVPYVYFASQSYSTHLTNPYTGCPAAVTGSTYAGLGQLRPYGDSTQSTPTFVNPVTFQIISAGLDSNYGGSLSTTSAPGMFPGGQNYDQNDRDNITNFSAGKELSTSIPQ